MFQEVLLSAQMFVLLFSGCVKSSGVEYRGAQQISSLGLTCLNWTNATRDYDVLIHPDSQTGKRLAPAGSSSLLGVKNHQS